MENSAHVLLGGLVAALILNACAARTAEVDAADSEKAPDASALTTEGKVAQLDELRNEVYSEVITIDAELLEEHAALLAVEGVRVNRILNRGQFDGMLSPRGGGAYFSFTSLTNDYDQAPDLELQQWYFMSGFAGRNWGHVVRLEADSLLEVELADVPVELQADVPPPRSRPKFQQVGPDEVYVVRSIRVGESDILVALEVLSRDDYGVTFAWKTLAKFTPPTRD